MQSKGSYIVSHAAAMESLVKQHRLHHRTRHATRSRVWGDAMRHDGCEAKHNARCGHYLDGARRWNTRKYRQMDRGSAVK